MSHQACEHAETQEPADALTASAEGSASTSGAKAEQGARPPFDYDYDCVNDCISSQGVTSLLSGVVVGIGCATLPPLCAPFIAVSAGSVAGACAAACDELAAKNPGS